MMRNKLYAVALLVVSVHGVASAAGIPREIALENLKKNIQFVRDNLSSEPDRIGNILISQMAVPIGDRPEVLALFGEVVEKSTAPLVIAHATDALVLSVHRHLGRMNLEECNLISQSMQKALKKQTMSFQTRSNVAEAFLLLKKKTHVDSFGQDAYKIFLDILAHPKGPMDSDIRPMDIMSVVLEVMKFNRPESRALLRQVVAEYHVREYVNGEIEKFKGRKQYEQDYRDILKRLDALEVPEENQKKDR